MRTKRATDPMERILLMLAGGPPQPAQDRVAMALRRALTLRIFPGDRMPSERSLAESFGVSRITVRHAMVMLRDDGRVLSGGSRRAGTVSRPREPVATADEPLQAHVRRAVADIMVFRQAVEPAVARLAAGRADDALVTRLRAAAEALGPDPTAFRRADSEFHLVLAEACGNDRMVEAVLVSRAELLQWRDLVMMPDDVQGNRAQHMAIADAVAARDGEAAARLMHEHLRLTGASLG